MSEGASDGPSRRGTVVAPAADEYPRQRAHRILPFVRNTDDSHHDSLSRPTKRDARPPRPRCRRRSAASLVGPVGLEPPPTDLKDSGTRRPEPPPATMSSHSTSSIAPVRTTRRRFAPRAAPRRPAVPRRRAPLVVAGGRGAALLVPFSARIPGRPVDQVLPRRARGRGEVEHPTRDDLAPPWGATPRVAGGETSQVHPQEVLGCGGGECPAALIVQEVDDGAAGSAPSCCINPITSMIIRLSIINPSRKRSNVQASTETLRLVAGTPKKSPA
jgi:hypothetical protein